MNVQEDETAEPSLRATPQENSGGVTDGSGGKSSWIRSAGTRGMSTGLNGRKEQDHRDSAEVMYKETIQSMNGKFEGVGRAMMAMADSWRGDMMGEMERTLLRTLLRDSPRYNRVVEVIIKRWGSGIPQSGGENMFNGGPML